MFPKLQVLVKTSAKKTIAIAILATVLSAQAIAQDRGLTLAQAEEIALRRDPISNSLVAEQKSFDAREVSARQLPDPKLRVGVVNLPVDSFDLDQEAMTQVQFGLSQSFPRGRTSKLLSQKMALGSQEMKYQDLDRQGLIRRAVRHSWLDLHFAQEAKAILISNRGVMRDLEVAADTAYRTGTNTQQDLLRAELETALLEEQILTLLQKMDVARADLSKWIGRAAGQELASGVYALEMPLGEKALLDHLPSHASVASVDRRIEARGRDVQLAQQAYRPEWKLDVGYGMREGADLMGRDRSDFASAMITFSVPLYAGRKQSREVSAKREQVVAERYRRDEKLALLRQELERNYAAWRRLSERVEMYVQTVIPRAHESREAALRAYQTNVTDFSGLMRVVLLERSSTLQLLALEVDRAKAQSVLLYLQGE